MYGLTLSLPQSEVVTTVKTNKANNKETNKHMSNPTNKPPVFIEGVYKFRIQGEPETKKSPKSGNHYLLFTLECQGYYNGETGAVESNMDGEELAGWEFDFIATWLPDGRNIGLQQIHEGITPEPLTGIEGLERDEKSLVPIDPSTGAAFVYDGKELFATAHSEEFIAIDKRTGKPSINPLTQKPVVSYSRKIKRIMTP